MDFTIPEDVKAKLEEIDAFIEAEIVPLEKKYPQYLDHRREYARTDFENDGLPRPEWEDLLFEIRQKADAAGLLRYPLPKELGGSAGSNLGLIVIREHLAARGLGLHADLQSEYSIVGNFPLVNVLNEFGSEEQKAAYIEGSITGAGPLAFGLTEPLHGSDATWMETTARQDGDDWVINGSKRFNSVVHKAVANIVFARTSGADGDAKGITAFIVPMETPGIDIEYYHWTFNMPTDHAEVHFKDVRVPASAILYKEGEGLAAAQRFVHHNRIKQAASSVGAARYCIQESVEYTRNRLSFGKPLSDHQAIQFPLADLYGECEMLRNFIFRVAWELDQTHHMDISDKVAICNYRANRLACAAADQAMQSHGGLGYTRGKPFEHMYRHHRRYRLTEGSDEVQIRRIAAYLFGYAGPNKRPRAKPKPR